jgi:hypothetical protein
MKMRGCERAFAAEGSGAGFGETSEDRNKRGARRTPASVANQRGRFHHNLAT